MLVGRRFVCACDPPDLAVHVEYVAHLHIDSVPEPRLLFEMNPDRDDEQAFDARLLGAQRESGSAGLDGSEGRRFAHTAFREYGDEVALGEGIKGGREHLGIAVRRSVLRPVHRDCPQPVQQPAESGRVPECCLGEESWAPLEETKQQRWIGESGRVVDRENRRTPAPARFGVVDLDRSIEAAGEEAGAASDQALERPRSRWGGSWWGGHIGFDSRRAARRCHGPGARERIECHSG